MLRVILAILAAAAIILIPGSLIALSLYAAIRTYVKRRNKV